MNIDRIRFWCDAIGTFFLLVAPRKKKKTKERKERIRGSESSNSIVILTPTKTFVTQMHPISQLPMFRWNFLLNSGRFWLQFENFFCFSHVFFLLIHFKAMSCQAIAKWKFSKSFFTIKFTSNPAISCYVPALDGTLVNCSTSIIADIELTT